MYVLAFGAKIGTFFEGGRPPWPPRKNVVSQKKIQKLFLNLTPNFYFIILKYYEIVEEKDNFLFDDDQENDDQIPDPDEALKEAMAKLKVWKVSKFVIFGIAKYISSLR